MSETEKDRVSLLLFHPRPLPPFLHAHSFGLRNLCFIYKIMHFISLSLSHPLHKVHWAEQELPYYCTGSYSVVISLPVIKKNKA